jgi:hypothetical protein
MVPFHNFGVDYAEGGRLDASDCSDFKEATPMSRKGSSARFSPFDGRL